MNRSLLLPFGMKDGKLVSIEMVESGLACNCSCPCCGARLVAKKGEERQFHFAHEGGKECKHGLETALHIAAKQIIEKNKKITLPPVYIENSDHILFAAKEVAFDTIALEKRIDNMIPDIIISIKNKTLLIEIAVTHPVTFEKKNRIKQKGLSAIEINVIDLLNNIYFSGQIFKHDEFEHRLIEKTEFKSWINNTILNSFSEFTKKKSTPKEIKLINRNPALKYVDYCPLYKRKWNNGYKMGKSYAFYYEDCRHCEYCSEIEYRKKPYSDTPGPVSKVHCFGHYHTKLNELIAVFKKSES